MQNWGLDNMVCPIEFHSHVIVPALKVTNLLMPSRQVLILGTFGTESNFEHLVQNGGPALGLGQMEPFTYTAMLDYLTKRQKQLKAAIMSACYFETMPSAEALIWNMRFAVLMTAVKYYEFSDPLPSPNDAQGLMEYYKKYYNSDKGKANSDHALPYFQQACDIYDKWQGAQ